LIWELDSLQKTCDIKWQRETLAHLIEWRAISLKLEVENCEQDLSKKLAEKIEKSEFYQNLSTQLQDQVKALQFASESNAVELELLYKRVRNSEEILCSASILDCFSNVTATPS
jgi:hypothetical protein